MYTLLNSILDYLADVTIGVLNHAFDTPAIYTGVETISYNVSPTITDYDDILRRYNWMYTGN